MLVSKKPCRPNVTPNLPNVTPNLSVIHSVPNSTPSVPNASQWNILHVGYARVGFVSPLFRVGYANSTQRECSFQRNMDLNVRDLL